MALSCGCFTVAKPKPKSALMEVDSMRKTEQELCAYLESLSDSLKSSLVFHRGMHVHTDFPDENTLRAFEIPWVNGVSHCECDIHAISDGNLVINHDADMKAVTRGFTDKEISQMSLIDVFKIPLKNHQRLNFLKEAMESAKLISKELGNECGMVIELKQSSATVNHLNEFFANNSQYLPYVSLVMSFFPEMIREVKLPKTNRLLLLNSPIRTDHVWELSENDLKWSSTDKHAEAQLLKLKQRNGVHGFYVEFEMEFLNERKTLMEKLCSDHIMGVWNVIPDSKDTLEELASIGFGFINTDYGRHTDFS